MICRDQRAVFRDPLPSIVKLAAVSRNSALVATDHCKVLIDGGLSARPIGVDALNSGRHAEQLDGVLLTHEHGDHICGLEVLCRKFHVPDLLQCVNG